MCKYRQIKTTSFISRHKSPLEIEVEVNDKVFSKCHNLVLHEGKRKKPDS